MGGAGCSIALPPVPPALRAVLAPLWACIRASIDGEGRGMAKREGRPGWTPTPSPLLLLALLKLLPGSGSTGMGAAGAGAYPGTGGGSTAIATGVSPAANGDVEGVPAAGPLAPRGFRWLSVFAPPSGSIPAAMASPPAEAGTLATAVRPPKTPATRLRKWRMRPPSVAVGGAAQGCAGAPAPGAAAEAAATRLGICTIMMPSWSSSSLPMPAASPTLRLPASEGAWLW